MNNHAFFRDCFNPRPLEDGENFKTFNDAAIPKDGLKVVFEATHSGIVNNNLKMYIPSLMEAGTDSFVNRKKPAKILKHHRPDADPVGVVTGAEYISTIPDSLKNDKNVKILTDKTSSFKTKLKAAKSFLKSGIPYQEDFSGLGYIKLYGYVTDETSIKQIKDKRFDAVSTSFISPDGVHCSECGQNFITDGRCEHTPGKRIEDEDGNVSVPVLIPAVHKYREVSLVVFDADPFTVVEIANNSDSNKKEVYNLNIDKLNSDANFEKFAYVINDSEEEVMKLSDKQKKVLDEIKQLRPDLEDAVAEKYAVKLASVKDKDGQFPDQKLAEIEDSVALQYALEDLETSEEEINADEVYAAMEEFLSEDAKLSTESRKKLPESAFCGPNKSFPVNDCAHVTAARRLIGKYKGPGNKTAILACVNRKAKAFGCDSSDSDKDTLENSNTDSNVFVLPTCDNLSSLTNEDMKILFSMAETELIGRKLKVSRECSKCAESADRLEVATKEKDEAVAKLTDLETRIDALRYEYRIQARDYESQVDENIKLADELNSAKLDKLSLISVLSGQHEDQEKAIESFRDSDLSEVEIIVMKDFKLEDAVARLNDGMHHAPEGTVESPAPESKDAELFNEDNLKGIGKKALDNVRKFISTGAIDQAYTLFSKMQDCEVFPLALKFENLIEKKPTD